MLINKNFHDLHYLLKCTNKIFDIIAVSKTSNMKKVFLTLNINLNLIYFYWKNKFQKNSKTSHSKTLIDNVFFNIISNEVISDNITGTKFHHLPQLLFIPHALSDSSCQKSNIYERLWSKIIQ